MRCFLFKTNLDNPKLVDQKVKYTIGFYLRKMVMTVSSLTTRERISRNQL
ncbi:MAG: hypothetical protein ACJAZW_001824 [Maritalea sp.]|jgi:hypothetical protein